AQSMQERIRRSRGGPPAMDSTSPTALLIDGNPDGAVGFAAFGHFDVDAKESRDIVPGKKSVIARGDIGPGKGSVVSRLAVPGARRDDDDRVHLRMQVAI